MRRLVLVAALTLTSIAFAQQQRANPQPPQKEIIYDDGDLVAGGVEGPATTLIPAPPDRTPHTSLIQIRDSFADKVLESQAELR